LLEHDSAKHSVATLQVAGKRFVHDRARLRFDDSDDSVVAGGEPGWHFGLAVGEIGAADELDCRLGKFASDYGVPLGIDLLVVVDESDEVAGASRDACVACVR
jgi:hypothetical protein